MSDDGHQIDPELRAHYEQDLAVSEQRWRFERRLQGALVVFGVALLAIIFVAIWASTIRARVATEAYGDGAAGDGWPSSLRVLVRDPKSGALLRPLAVEVALQVAGEPAQPIDNVGLTAESAAALLHLDAAALARGARVALAVRTDEETDQLELGLQPAPATGTGAHLVDSVHALQRPEALQGASDALPSVPVVEVAGRALQLRFFPESGTLVPVLMNRVLLLALDGQNPAAGVTLRIDPLGWTVKTDPLGLAELQWTPGRELGALTLTPIVDSEAQPAMPRPVKVALAAPPSQLLLKPRQALVAPGGEIAIDVQSVRLRTLLSYEVWYGRRLVAQSDLAVDGGHALLELPAPERAGVLVGVRAQRTVTGEDQVNDQAFMWVDHGDARGGLERLHAQLGAELAVDPGLQALAHIPVVDEADAERRLRLLLSRLELDDRPRLVASSAARNQARAEARRATWQRWLFGGYWTLGLGALGLSTAAVLLHNRRLYLRLRDLGADDPVEAEQTARAIRKRGTLELLAVVSGVIFGLFIVYHLLSTLWWG